VGTVWLGVVQLVLRQVWLGRQVQVALLFVVPAVVVVVEVEVEVSQLKSSRLSKNLK